jgi:hypothetical protein
VVHVLLEGINNLRKFEATTKMSVITLKQLPYNVQPPVCFKKRKRKKWKARHECIQERGDYSLIH